jgi:hypothetical protein
MPCESGFASKVDRKTPGRRGRVFIAIVVSRFQSAAALGHVARGPGL